MELAGGQVGPARRPDRQFWLPARAQGKCSPQRCCSCSCWCSCWCWCWCGGCCCCRCGCRCRRCCLLQALPTRLHPRCPDCTDTRSRTPHVVVSVLRPDTRHEDTSLAIAEVLDPQEMTDSPCRRPSGPIPPPPRCSGCSCSPRSRPLRGMRYAFTAAALPPPSPLLLYPRLPLLPPLSPPPPVAVLLPPCLPPACPSLSAPCPPSLLACLSLLLSPALLQTDPPAGRQRSAVDVDELKYFSR